MTQIKEVITVVASVIDKTIENLLLKEKLGINDNMHTSVFLGTLYGLTASFGDNNTNEEFITLSSQSTENKYFRSELIQITRSVLIELGVEIICSKDFTDELATYLVRPLEQLRDIRFVTDSYLSNQTIGEENLRIILSDSILFKTIILIVISIPTSSFLEYMVDYQPVPSPKRV